MLMIRKLFRYQREIVKLIPKKKSQAGVVDINHAFTSTTMLYLDWVSVYLNLTSRVFSGQSSFHPPQNWLLVYSAKRATVSTRQRFLTLFWHFLIEGRGFSDSLKFTRERDLRLPRRSWTTIEWIFKKFVSVNKRVNLYVSSLYKISNSISNNKSIFSIHSKHTVTCKRERRFIW